MNSQLQMIMAVIVAAVIVLSGLAYFEAAGHKDKKGEYITLATGDNLTTPLTKIVSLDPAATETLYALGAYNMIVGDTGLASYPSNSTVQVVGSYPAMDLEEILNLSPQAVISFDSAYSQGQITKLLDAGINYVFLNAGAGSGIASIEKQTTLLGKLTGKEKNAYLLDSWMNQSLSSISNATKSIKTQQELTSFYYLSSSGGIYTSGNGTFFNDILTHARLKNVASNLTGGFVPMSAEMLANNSPQVIFLDQYVNKSALTIYPFNTSTAVKDGNVFTLPNEDIFTEPDFRDIFAITWMVKVAYSVNVTLPVFPLHLSDNPDPLNG